MTGALKVYDGVLWQYAVTAGVGKNYVDQTSSNRPGYSYTNPIAGLPNAYSPERGIYNYKASNTRRLEQGLTLAMAGGMTEQLVIGDSGSAGCNSSVGVNAADRLNAWPLAMRDQLANLGIPANGSGSIRTVDGTFALLDTRLGSFTGTWTNSGYYATAVTLGASAIITFDRPGTVLDVWYQTGTNATFTVAVNGAASGTGFATQTTGASNTGFTKVRLTGLNMQPGATVKLTVTVAGSGVRFSTISNFTPNAGLVIHNMGQSGAWATGTGAQAWVDATTGPGILVNGTGIAGKRRTVTNASSVSGSSTLTSATGAFTAADVGTPLDFVPDATGIMWSPDKHYFIGQFLTSTTVAVHTMVSGVSTAVTASQTKSSQTAYIGRDPSAVHIELGLNDLSNAVAIATITAAITTIAGWFPNSDIVLHAVHEMNYSTIALATQQAYTQALYNLADTLDVPLYDWRDRAGTYAQGLAAGIYGDSFVHGTPAYYKDLGASLATVIGGGSGVSQSIVAPVTEMDLTNKKYVDDRVRVGRLLTTSVPTTTETIIAQVPIPANYLKAGSAIDFNAIFKSAGASIATAKLRIGVLGTIADAAVLTVGVGTSVSTTQRLDGDASVLTIGVSGTYSGAGTVQTATTSNIPTAAPSLVTIDTTKDNFISLTLVNGTSTTTTVYAGKLAVSVA